MQELTYKWTYLFSKVNAKAITKQIAIAIGFAAAYWAISSANPALAKTFIASDFVMKFKFANALRAFGLVFGPAAIIGTGIGAQAFNITTGTAGWFGMSFIPIIVTLLGLLIIQISKVWGRAWYKDVLLLGIYGAVAGLVIALRLSGIAMLVSPESYQPLFEGLVLGKVVTSAAIYMMGYPLIKGWEAIKNGKSSSSK